MPSANEILAGLNATANDYEIFAIAWHGVFYAVFILLALEWKPSNRVLLSFLSLPLFSAAVFAWSSGNPFNGITFTLLAVFVLVSGIKVSGDKIRTSETPFAVSGVVMILFGIVYPHFIETDSVFKYLYASPAGLIPCPTLSVVTGFVLLYRGFGSRLAVMMFIVYGLFYGLVGVFKLGVFIDGFLLFGAVMMGVGLVSGEWKEERTQLR